MARHRLNQRGSGPIWFVMLIVVLFVLYSVTIALSTADECGDLGREWQVFPPEWECVGTPGFG
jgi:hypothetical protein